ncbi:TPA: hypothetical protein MM324_000094 [Klebsiella pneumoniae]|nr:hypothetical protein [Klebsiella pneumoniae]HCC8495814.1 hypothetical protein [Klebsiella pneumoniae]
MNIETVNELIASLESAGEPSIREQKFLKLAKAFKQLAAENVVLKAGVLEAFEEMESHHDTNGLYSYDADGEQMDALIRLCDAQGTISDLLSMLETTATDRIVAGIKADGVEEFAAKLRIPGDDQFFDALAKGVAIAADDFAKQLREGADK